MKSKKQQILELKSSNNKKAAIKYSRSKKGVIYYIYKRQCRSSIDRGHNLPEYNRIELSEWVNSQKLFNKLYGNWAKSGYIKKLKPSIDRIDNNKGYSFKNIRLCTWSENSKRADIHAKENKLIRSHIIILQYDKHNNFIKEYPSAREATRKTGIHYATICNCCRGRLKNAGGYIWRYKNKDHYISKEYKIKILNHIINYGSVSLNDFLNLSKRQIHRAIHNLRNEGHEIKTRMEVNKSTGDSFAVYYIEP